MPVSLTRQRIERLDNQTGGENVDALRRELQRSVQLHAGVFRTDEILSKGVSRNYGDCRARETY